MGEEHSRDWRHLEGAALHGDEIGSYNDASEAVVDSNDMPPKVVFNKHCKKKGKQIMSGKEMFHSNLKYTQHKSEEKD
ncbi:hypothetical protein ZWY2020_029871 [Hordeum vulgare]|nr:hypothetical protein ZWY2020_029871 [Hordeum vulgare]